MCFTKIKEWLVLVVLLLHFSLIQSQDNFTSYWQPAVALNYKVAGNYSHNFSIQNRNFIYDDGASQLRARQIDFVHFSNFKVRENQSLAFGVLYRSRNPFDGGSNELRLTQQYNLQSRPYVIRYGHRLRGEQRITKKTTIHRFRYRFSIDFPLQGEKLDVGEPYLVGNLESLLSVAQMQQPQYDTRFTLNFGWQLTSKTKFQIGTEYRIEDFSQNLEHVLFFLSTLNFSI